MKKYFYNVDKEVIGNYIAYIVLLVAISLNIEWELNMFIISSAVIGAVIGTLLKKERRRNIGSYIPIILIYACILLYYFLLNFTDIFLRFEYYLTVSFLIYFIYIIIKKKTSYIHIPILIILLIGSIFINYYLTKDNLIKDRDLEKAIKDELSRVSSSTDINKSNLEKIKKLYIFGNDSVNNLEGIKYLKNLKDLWVEDIRDTRNMEEIKLLNNLEQLQISDCNIKDIEFIKDIDTLKKLELWKVKVNDGYIIPNIPNLKHISIAKIKSKNLQFLKNNNTIESLNIFDCNLSSYNGIEKFKSLKEFEYSGDSFRETDEKLIELLNSVEKVSITINEINDINFLSNIDNIRELEIRNYTDIINDTEERSKVIIPSIAKLKKLSLYNMNLYDLSIVKNTDPIESISLISCDIDSFKGIEMLINLKELNISSGTIKESDMEYLLQLNSLEKIELENCEIGDENIIKLKELPNVISFQNLK